MADNNGKVENDILYNNWSSYLENTRDRTNYSIRRMDLLLITLSGGGIYIIFEILRFYKSHPEITDDLIWLKVSGILLFLAIVSNFISQKTGYLCNNNEEKYILKKLAEIRNEKVDLNELDLLDCNVRRWNTLTNWLNHISIFLMLFGFIILVILNLFIF